MLHALGLHGNIHNILKHLVGSLQRRAFRQDDARNQVQLVLHRDKPGRHCLEHHAGTKQQQRVDHKHRATMLQGTSHAALVLVGAGVKETVEGSENPAEQRIDHAGEPILGRVMGLEQHRCQRGRQGQGVDGGDHRGDGNRHRELAIELTGHPRQEGHGNKHRAQHQPHGNDRPGDFFHGLMSGGLGLQALFDVTLHVFHHHDGVVHHDTDGQHQPKQGQRVDGVAQQVKRPEGADHRDRHRQQRDNGRTPGLQE